MSKRVYKPNQKHKRGTFGEGPPRWFLDAATLCPDEMDATLCQELLDGSIEGRDQVHPDQKARYAHYRGGFFKAYSEGLDPATGASSGMATLSRGTRSLPRYQRGC